MTAAPRDGASAHRIPSPLVACLLAGLAAGALVGGMGIRLAMRVSALATSEAHRGTLTDAGVIPGTITFGGSLFLVVFGAGAGLLGGLYYFWVRHALPSQPRRRAWAFAGVSLALFAVLVIQDANHDFRTFGPVWLNLPMYASLFVAYGYVAARLHARLERGVPRSPHGIAAVALLALLGLFALPFLLGAVSEIPGAVVHAPVSTAALVAPVVASTVPRIARRGEGAASAVLVASCAAGAAALAWEMAQILHGAGYG